MNLRLTSESPSPAPSTEPGLLLIAYHFGTTAESGAVRPSRFAKYLAKAGLNVQVVTQGDPSLTSSQVCYVRPGMPARRGVGIAGKVAQHIERRLLPYNEAAPWTPYAIEASVEIIRRTPISSILSTSPPLATHFAAWELKRRFNLHWIADFRDPLSDNPFRNRRYAGPYDRAIEQWLFRSADCVIANTDTVADIWRNRYARWSYKIHVIWNGYDSDDRLYAAPIPPRPWSVLTHVGTLYGGRRPTILLDSLVRLMQSDRIDPHTFRLRLVGPLDTTLNRIDKPPFSTLIERGCLHCTGQPVPRTEAHQEIATADRLLLMDLNESGTALQVPAKLFEYIRIGRPILAFTPTGSPTERILAGSGIRYTAIPPTAPTENVDGFVSSFLKQPTDPVPPSAWFSKHFDSRAQTNTLRALL